MTDSPLLDIIHPEVACYIDSLSVEADPHVIRMATYAKEYGVPRVDLEAGRWLELLTRMVGGKRVFEFGSAFGFSSYYLARAVGPKGIIHGSETDPKLCALHAEVFAGHPYRERISLQNGDGVALLRKLTGSFDVVFIDMDKPGYPAALRAAVDRVRVGGLVLADNVLWSGRVKQASDRDANTCALREFNQMTHTDARLQTLVLPASDGISVSLRVA